MPPRFGTRYQFMRAFQDPDTEGWDLEVPDALRFTNEVDNVPHTVGPSDTLQILAYRHYKGFPNSAQLWRAIAEFNDIIDATLPLKQGRLLIIPSERWVREVFLAPPRDFRLLIARIGESS